MKSVGILGATGAVGREMLKVLYERKFPVGKLKLFASARSAGTKMLFGDEEITGKPHGGDLKSGVITLPVIRALEVSDNSAELKKIVTSGTDVDAAIKIILDTDAVDYCRTRAEAHIDSARINLPLTLKTSVALAL